MKILKKSIFVERKEQRVNLFLWKMWDRPNDGTEWETSSLVSAFEWKQIAEPVMRLYTETTDGSTIETKETALVWNYEFADPDFGSCQAKELMEHLESVLTNDPVSVKTGQQLVEVKPQVRYKKSLVSFIVKILLALYFVPLIKTGCEQRSCGREASNDDAGTREAVGFHSMRGR